MVTEGIHRGEKGLAFDDAFMSRSQASYGKTEFGHWFASRFVPGFSTPTVPRRLQCRESPRNSGVSRHRRRPRRTSTSTPLMRPTPSISSCLAVAAAASVALATAGAQQRANHHVRRFRGRARCERSAALTRRQARSSTPFARPMLPRTRARRIPSSFRPPAVSPQPSRAADVSATEARWSPDGKHVAYVAGDQLWVADAERRDAQATHRLNGGATGPVWAPTAIGSRSLPPCILTAQPTRATRRRTRQRRTTR